MCTNDQASFYAQKNENIFFVVKTPFVRERPIYKYKQTTKSADVNITDDNFGSFKSYLVYTELQYIGNITIVCISG